MTHHVDLNLPLTLKQKFRLCLACPDLARPKRSFVLMSRGGLNQRDVSPCTLLRKIYFLHKRQEVYLTASEQDRKTRRIPRSSTPVRILCDFGKFWMVRISGLSTGFQHFREIRNDFIYHRSMSLLIIQKLYRYRNWAKAAKAKKKQLGYLISAVSFDFLPFLSLAFLQ